MDDLFQLNLMGLQSEEKLEEKSAMYENLFFVELNRAWEFVECKLRGTTLVHSRAVAKIGRSLAICEGANPVIVQIAAFFHDIAKDQVSFEDHAKAAIQIFYDFIYENNGCSVSSGLPSELIENITHCIEAHSFCWGNIGPKPETIEAKVLSDADMLQQLSPFGLVKHMEKHAALPYAERLENTLKDLERAHDVLLTPTAQRLGQEKMQYARDFIRTALSGH